MNWIKQHVINFIQDIPRKILMISAYKKTTSFLADLIMVFIILIFSAISDGSEPIIPVIVMGYFVYRISITIMLRKMDK